MTNMQTIKIGDATPSQLVQFLRETLGISSASTSMSRERLIAMIRAAHNGESIKVVAYETVKPAAKVGIAEAIDGNDTKAGERLAELMIQAQPGPGGREPVFVGVNGVGVLLPRDERIVVRERYYDALNMAKQRIPVLDERTSEVVGWREAHTYPFNFYGFRNDKPESETAKAG